MDYLYTKNAYDFNNLYGITTTNTFPYIHENQNNINGRAIYYISDIHAEFKDKKGFTDVSYAEYINHIITNMNGGGPFGDDPLLIAGDISCFSSQVDYFFSQLRMRREGIIIFVLGNHEIWNEDNMSNRNLPNIIEQYREICSKHDVILLHNELAFFYDDRTQNGELLHFFRKKIISANDLLSIDSDTLREYSIHAKFIVFGGLGFSGNCKTVSQKGTIYNAEFGLYKDIIPTLKEDIIESQKCENAYIKTLNAIGTSNVIVLTHSPFDNWSTLEYNPNFIYVSGHTHHNYFENTNERTIFADNQVGYSSDCYDLKHFYIDGTYDLFKYYNDGIYKITYEQYIDFNIGKNIQLKMKNDGKQIYMLKRSNFYMFVYYNSNNKLILLNGGTPKRLTYDIKYYYDNLEDYVLRLTSIMNKYTSALSTTSYIIKKIGGNGTIHGCIVDIDYNNHIYINPFDGRVVPYYAINTEQKYVYKNIESLLAEKCPLLLPNYQKWKNKESDTFMLIPSSFEITNAATLVTDKSMYKASMIIKTIQYLLFKNVIRDWNDKIIYKNNSQSYNIFDEISKMQIDDSILKQ